ncbi:hypothetical protein Ahy_B04g069762 [Arachis hypogaea]|uniref:Uncharacterized protein n=1 Tax=Arachis hypogaea TaxID=3818 RepID=A0A444ZDG9_ARAHY|nr:hypothetical protein Ahy_B04g069762 [Arachis hypogaea]
MLHVLRARFFGVQPPNLNPNFTSKFQSPSVHPTPTNATIPPSLPQSTPHQSCCHWAEGPPTGGVIGFIWSFGHLISEASVVRVVCSSGKLLCQRLGISSPKLLSSGRLSCTDTVKELPNILVFHMKKRSNRRREGNINLLFVKEVADLDGGVVVGDAGVNRKVSIDEPPLITVSLSNASDEVLAEGSADGGRGLARAKPSVDLKLLLGIVVLDELEIEVEVLEITNKLSMGP